jgi:hypothetical protein
LPISGLSNTVSGSNAAATKEPGEPDHAGDAGGASIWWKWTAPTNGLVTVDTIGSACVTLLAVYTGSSVSNLSLVANDNGCNGNCFSMLTFPGVARTQYQIAVDGECLGPIVLTVQEFPPPSNDMFARRLAITGKDATVSGSNQGATKEPGEPDHAGNAGGASVWWKWKAPANGSVTVDTIGSSFGTILAVYTGSSVSALTWIESDDESGGNGTSQLVFTAVAGKEYEIAVDGYDGATGSVTLSLHETP